MSAIVKPRVAGIILLGHMHAPKYMALNQPVLFCKHRGLYDSRNRRCSYTDGPCTLFSKQLDVGESSNEAALQCAITKFWWRQKLSSTRGGKKLQLHDFEILKEGVETTTSIFDVWLFRLYCKPTDITCVPNGCTWHTPLNHIDRYVRDRNFSNATLDCLAAVPPLNELFGRLFKP